MMEEATIFLLVSLFAATIGLACAAINGAWKVAKYAARMVKHEMLMRPQNRYYVR